MLSSGSVISLIVSGAVSFNVKWRRFIKKESSPSPAERHKQGSRCGLRLSCYEQMRDRIDERGANGRRASSEPSLDVDFIFHGHYLAMISLFQEMEMHKIRHTDQLSWFCLPGL
ncbi:hypothetical protein IW262DRAFT_303711 [Armillaria fumosa]|nr:hypothetical protein IW262DRAFT_303711 [Armillaria fumosa]